MLGSVFLVAPSLVLAVLIAAIGTAATRRLLLVLVLRLVGVALETTGFVCAILATIAEDFWVGLLELVEHLVSVLGEAKLHGHLLDGGQDLHTKRLVLHNGDGLLQHVVSELMGDKALDNLVHSYFLVS